MVYRHPFPGPGLGVRILGEVKREFADLLRRADAIFIEELRNTTATAQDAAAGLCGEADVGKSWYDLTSQAFAVFLPVKSVGVMGDGRTYDYVTSLRAVQTTDFMTAHWAHLPYALLGRASNRIINEVRGINRVVYDISASRRRRSSGSEYWLLNRRSEADGRFGLHAARARPGLETAWRLPSRFTSTRCVHASRVCAHERTQVGRHFRLRRGLHTRHERVIDTIQSVRPRNVVLQPAPQVSGHLGIDHRPVRTARFRQPQHIHQARQAVTPGIRIDTSRHEHRARKRMLGRHAKQPEPDCQNRLSKPAL